MELICWYKPRSLIVYFRICSWSRKCYLLNSVICVSRPNVNETLRVTRDKMLPINCKTECSHLLFMLKCSFLFVFTNIIPCCLILLLRLYFQRVWIDVLIIACNISISFCDINHHFQYRALRRYSFDTYFLRNIIHLNLLICRRTKSPRWITFAECYRRHFLLMLIEFNKALWII